VQTTVATLLLITSAVLLTCVVIDYAVGIIQQTLNTDNIPQLDKIRDIENRIQNQTDSLFNQAPPELPTQQSP
jgi:hypothetical protein